MKKKSIYFIAILIPLIFILGMFMFRLVIPKSCLGSDIRKTIDFEIDFRLKRGFDVNYNNVYLMFYSVDNVQYLSIYFTNRYEPDRFKGLCIYRNKTIIYEGIDNNIAKKYICIKALSMTEPNIDPKYIGFNDSDPRVEYYRISNNRFIKFNPSEDHIDSITNKLIILNYLQAPPPVPEE
jgi:hypothetical protein